MFNLMKIYSEFPSLEKGRVGSLEDVTDKVKQHWPEAWQEGSAGLGRHYLIRNKELNNVQVVAYCAGYQSRKTHEIHWRYIVFSEPKDL